MIDWVQLLFPYRRHLEVELIQLRSDFQERLRDNKVMIDRLETELMQSRGECDRMRLVLMPLSTAAGAAYARVGQAPSAPPKFEPIVSSWQNELKKAMSDIEKLEADAVKEITNGF